MTDDSISQKEWEINRHNEIIEDISEYINKAKALIAVVLKCNLSSLSSDTLHNYLEELESLIDTIENVFEDLK